MRLASLLVAGTIGAVTGAGGVLLADVGHPSVSDLRVAALGFEDSVRTQRQWVREHCGRVGWPNEKERALAKLAEQEAAFNFAVIWMHAYDTSARSMYDRVASEMKNYRAEVEALRCDG